MYIFHCLLHFCYIIIVRNKSACTVKNNNILRVKKTRKYLIFVATEISYCREQSKLKLWLLCREHWPSTRLRCGKTDYAENVVYIELCGSAANFPAVQKLFRRRPFWCNFIKQMSKKKCRTVLHFIITL